MRLGPSQPARVITKSCPSSAVTVGPPGGVVGGCAWTSESHVSAPNRAEASMIPLVAQTPGPTGTPSLPGGFSSATRVAVEGVDADGTGWAIGELEAPDRAVAPLGGHDGPALGRAVLVRSRPAPITA
jgi:hypothetical protein